MLRDHPALSQSHSATLVDRTQREWSSRGTFALEIEILSNVDNRTSFPVFRSGRSIDLRLIFCVADAARIDDLLGLS